MNIAIMNSKEVTALQSFGKFALSPPLETSNDIFTALVEILFKIDREL